MIPDWEERYAIIVGLGRKLTPMDEALQTEETLVKGCLSQVWLIPGPRDGDKLSFIADSDAVIVKGLIAVVLMIFSGKTAAEIAATDESTYFTQLGLTTHISPNRQNGLHAMVARIKTLAAATTDE